MKKAFILGSAFLLLAGLFTVACKNIDGGHERNTIPSQNGNGEEKIVGGFSLIISVENPIVQQGEDFRVNIELKNNNEEDKEIFCSNYHVLFEAHIPNCDLPIVAVDPPFPPPPPFRSELLEAGGVIQGEGLIIDSFYLKRGTHDLRFVSRFSVYLSEDNLEPIEVWSNTIRLTVQ